VGGALLPIFFDFWGHVPAMAPGQRKKGGERGGEKVRRNHESAPFLLSLCPNGGTGCRFGGEKGEKREGEKKKKKEGEKQEGRGAKRIDRL